MLRKKLKRCTKLSRRESCTSNSKCKILITTSVIRIKATFKSKLLLRTFNQKLKETKINNFGRIIISTEHKNTKISSQIYQSLMIILESQEILIGDPFKS